MNESQVAHRIADRLNDGLDLPRPVATRLAGARQRALQAFTQRERVFVLPGGIEISLSEPTRRWILPGVLMIAAAFALSQWQAAYQEQQRHLAEQQAAALADIDSAMLTDELPLDAYLDGDFYAWLKNSR